MRSLFMMVFFAAIVCVSGCGKENKTTDSTPEPTQKPVSRLVAEEVTGYRAVQQGRQVQEKIRRISEEHDRDMQDVLEGVAE